MTSSEGFTQTLKEQGNEHFKDRDFVEAAGIYKKLESLSPDDPVLSSNLSTALYELGDYAGCFHAICRAAKKTSQSNHSGLLLKLSSRLARTLSQGFWSGIITPPQIEDEKDTIEALKSAAKNVPEVQRLWGQWYGAESRSKEEIATAKRRLADLPIFKRTFSSHPEYISIGHDELLNIVNDFGGSDDPIYLDRLTSSQLKNLAFMFAGVGDAHHVFGSIIGLGKVYAKLTQANKSNFQVHFTLVDINPTVFARDLCIMLLLNDLLTKKMSSSDKQLTEATLFYVYAAVIMPEMCHNRFLQVARKLSDNLRSKPPQLPAWIHVDSIALPPILDSLDFWTLEMLPRSVASIFSSIPCPTRQNRSSPITDAMDPRLLLNSLSEEQLASAVAEYMPTPCPSRHQPQQRAKWLKEGKEKSISEFAKIWDGGLELRLEREWYNRLKSFVPPRSIRGPVQDGVWKNIWTLDDFSNPDLDKAAEEIKCTWKINASLYNFMYDLVPDMVPTWVGYDAFSLVDKIQDFNRRVGIEKLTDDIDKDCPSLFVFSTFFNAVVDALKTLKGKITVELFLGEMCQTLATMRSGDQRPANFPRKFNRMWLSNVPDYTHGPLNTAVYLVPCLVNDIHSAVSSNCLINPKVWGSSDEFCHGYTLLPIADVPRFLGCVVKDMAPTGGVITLQPWSQPYPLPLSKLASREELTHWLTRLLLLILATPKYMEKRLRWVFIRIILSLS
ncbi:hypothetical protein BT96DRAFT_371276 [Gymnopus androsaceus JB14]|uniref:DUF4470 domain-containing protein n=1 Tax=Gymnopus androsaceus JB14 TaxID=1447944 RepID=A0A6A4II67_9AGAR|nr:hypothetical protein BT96DRAFT_371276 [Gymnopus androsaceus JB14]